MLNKILLGVAVLIIVFSVVVMLQPDTYRVERSIEIEAPAGNVFPHIADLQQWPTWSPWAKRDPAMKMEFSDETTGVGAYAAWDSETEGRGKQTISDVIENQSLMIDLEFITPFEAQATTDLTIKPGANEGVVLTWGMNGSNDGFIAKVFYLLMDFDQMIGADYDTGLQALKMLSEQDMTNPDQP